MAPLRYSHALVCRVSSSFAEEDSAEQAKLQHEAYVRALRDLGLDVIEMPPDETLPNCVYIEDTAIICNGIVLIAKPKDEKRLKEVDIVRAVLKKELELPVVEVVDEQAYLEGGDVLFTGQEFFVGISDFTNEAGARALARAFPEFPCAPIKVPEKKHLKAFISMAGPEVLCISSEKASQDVLKRIEREATFVYQTLTVPEEDAANVMYINGTLIHRASEEIPQAAKIFTEKIDFNRKSLAVSYLCKNPMAHLSSCCLLLRKSKHIRSL
ncbi:unnamed protein product [Nezara viridula]|uniref:Dimethylargininase n=1 Tax=Nezara viridula TaxID=85310 RepID=A0A9P0H7I3_NEZVI|nr:unnamed protein product [Nezara viridula]CAH1396862.1 unnamed protein product [Nezara viridula]